MQGGRSFAAAFLNRNSGPLNLTLSLLDLDLTIAAAAYDDDNRSQHGSPPTTKTTTSPLLEPEPSSYAVRDLWAHTDNGTVAGDANLTVEVGGEDVVVVALTPPAQL